MVRLILTTVPRKRTLLFQRLLLLSFCFPPTAALSQAPAITATVDVAKTGVPISKNIYGQFLEHGGDIVNAGIWSEMLVRSEVLLSGSDCRTEASARGRQCRRKSKI